MRSAITIMLLFLCLSVSAQGQPGSASASPADVDTPTGPETAQQRDRRAQELFLRGDRLYAEGKYEEAVQAFVESYELSNRHLILVALANSYERLARYEMALVTLRKYAPHSQLAEEHTIRERIRVLQNRVDDDHEAEKRKKELQAASSSNGTTPETIETGSPDLPLRDDNGRRKFAGRIFLVGGGAALATGLTFGLLARHARGKAEGLCAEQDGENVCLSAAQTYIDRDRRFSVVADVSVLLGAASVITGALLTYYADSEQSPMRHAAIATNGQSVTVGFNGAF